MICQPSHDAEESNTHLIDMSINAICECPHKTCPFETRSGVVMRKDFRLRHLEDIISIEPEGLLP